MKEFRNNNGFILRENSRFQYNIYCEMVKQYKKRPILDLQIIDKLRKQRRATSVKYVSSNRDSLIVRLYRAYRPYSISYPYRIQQLTRKKDLLWILGIRNTPEEISYYKNNR